MEPSEILRLFIMGMMVSLIVMPTFMLIVGTYRRSVGLLSFCSLVFVYPLNVAIRYLPLRDERYINVRVKNTDTDRYKFRFTSSLPFYFYVEQSELIDLYENYVDYNDLPLTNEDYPYFEDYTFYEGVSLHMNICDCCSSRHGTHKVRGSILRIIPVRLMFCSDCFDEVTKSISDQIEDNPELMLASEI